MAYEGKKREYPGKNAAAAASDVKLERQMEEIAELPLISSYGRRKGRRERGRERFKTEFGVVLRQDGV